MKKPLTVFLLACGVCFIFFGCGVDELKKEVEQKNLAIKTLEGERAALNKKIQDLTAQLSAKDAEFKKLKSDAVTASGNLAIANTELGASKVQVTALTQELETVKAQLQECMAKKPNKKKK